MTKILKFGKSSESLLGIKKSFFEQNDAFLAYQRKIAALYIQQPRREACMCCAGPIEGLRFTKQTIEYILCARCGHLNGAYVDTDAFGAAVYTSSGDSEYGSLFYTEQDKVAFERRRDAIYTPKVDFLVASLAELGEKPVGLSYCDVGAGSGYLVAALHHRGLARSSGYEISASQVTFGNQMIGTPALQTIAPDDSEKIVSTTKHDVLALIGTLEHLQRPRDFLRAVTSNPHVKYLMISVPLYSPTVFLEMVFPEVMQRQLAGGHTHLYSRASLEYMAKEFGIAPVAEWWFGTDLVDLYRDVIVRMQANPETAPMADAWTQMFAPMIDDMQLVMDKRMLSSEVHVIYKVH